MRSRKSHSLNPILTDRCLTLDPKTKDSISDSSVPLDTLLSLIHCIETCESSNNALKDISSPHSSSERNKKRGKRDGHNGDERVDKAGCVDESITVTRITGVRDSFKRTTNRASLYESNERAHKSKKIQYASECASLHCRERV